MEGNQSKKTHEYNGEFTLKAGMAISILQNASKGSLGAIVYSTKDNKPMLLTNKHVITYSKKEAKEYNMNKGLILERLKHGQWILDKSLKARIEKGDIPVFHPPYQGGNKDAKIIAFVTRVSDQYDAALCELLPNVKYDAEIKYEALGRIKDPVESSNVFKGNIEK